MKKTIYPRLLIGFVLFGLLGFAAISTLTSRLVFQYVLKTEISNLSKEVKHLAKYAASCYNGKITWDDFQECISILENYLSAQVWVVESDGLIKFRSSMPADPDNQETIQNFKVSYFTNPNYQTGNFYGYFTEEQLSIYESITPTDFKLVGYVILHKPIGELVSYSNGLVRLIYITYALLLLGAFLLLTLFSYLTIRPIRKIAKAADEYARGKFDKPLNIRADGELASLAASLIYMAHELHTLEEDQRKFISNVSHDFRSPLTSVKGYVEAMLDGTIPAESQEKYLRIILFETERLNGLTASILELNQYGSRGTLLDRSAFDINHTIKMTVQSFEGACKDRRISFELILTGQTLFTRADIGKIQRVIYNLIDNAIKFSPSGSVITIETTVKNEKIFVLIKDRGIGIPKESIGKIWERFYKTDSSRGRDKKGTGLGLAIVKEIIQLHNENINVISTEGVGTEFIFSLPLVLPEED